MLLTCVLIMLISYYNVFFSLIIILHSFQHLKVAYFFFLFYIKSCKGVSVVGQTIVKHLKGEGEYWHFYNF